LKFSDPDGLEKLLMKECENDYKVDELDLDENSVVVDIGAHVGVVSMTLARKFGCKVYAYEPNPGNLERLRKNINLNGLSDLITVLPYAITKDGRDVTISTNKDNSGGGNIYSDGDAVSSLAFDKIIGSFDVIDLLKIDCEGAEYEFLPGADLSNVKAIRGEFHPGEGKSLLDEVIKQVPNTKVTLL